ncbi:MAG: hypothetical protein KDA80_13270 [Planctomycetaceae bacterium]|nr:hypothetical protein [Planctomycetaceae bacterium]
MATVFIPPALRRMTGDVRLVEISSQTVRGAVAELERMFPGIQDRLCDGDQLRPGISVSIDSRISGIGLLERVGPNSEVHFIATVHGG